LFGFAMVGADICGFWEEPTLELCLRWMQVGAFYPFSRNHNADGWQPQHPTWFNDTMMNQVSRDVLLTRYQLLPMFYTQFWNINRNGGTLFRSLAHNFPTDLETRNINLQFMLSSALLISPVVHESETFVNGYFPKNNRWFDFYTGDEVESGRYHKLDTPMEKINIHLKGGSIIPMQEPEVTTSLSRELPMKILVALDDSGAAVGQLYWDDGESRVVGDNYATLDFTCTLSGNVLTLNIDVTHSPQDAMTQFDSLIFNEVWVYGATGADDVMTIKVDGADVTEGDFQMFENGVVKINKNLALAVKDNHVIEWTL